MNSRPYSRYALPFALLLICILSGGCAYQTDSEPQQKARINTLAAELQALSPSADPREAEHFADVAVITAANLREQYQVTMAPWIHNMEVNAGKKPRGLCFHYAKDMAAALQPLAAPDWQLYFVQAKPKEILEHNAVVVTAKGKPWQSGIVLDGWRHSGVLYFGPVMEDRYPWQLKSRISKIPDVTTSGHPGS
jgi:hypothetical protein